MHKRYVRRGFICFGLVGTLIVGEGAAHDAVLLAQTPASGLGRLSVRPREIATATRTDRAGQYVLDSVKNVLVYVPKLCVGTRRCPLVVFLHGEKSSAKQEIELQSQLADKYGMILLAFDEILPDTKSLDAALTQVLRRFAIDPEKIALAGESTGGMGALFFGPQNFDIFNRIAPLSAAYVPRRTSPLPMFSAPPPSPQYPSDTSRGPQNKKTQFFVSAGIGERGDDVRRALEVAQRERQDGHAVKVVLNLRLRTRRLQDYNYMWHWLQESWAAPSRVTQGTPSAAASGPLLTAAALIKMTNFWTSFMAGPDAARLTGRQTHQREKIILVGQEKMSVLEMVDIPALAAKYASVATALKKAGLSAKEEEAYRTALISARVTQITARPVEATSVSGRNLAFISKYRDASNALLALIGIPRCENSAVANTGCGELLKL